MEKYYEGYVELDPVKSPYIPIQPCYWMGGDKYVDWNGSYTHSLSCNEYVVDYRPPQEKIDQNLFIRTK